MADRVAATLTEHCDGRVVTWTLDAPARKNAVSPDALRYIEGRSAALSGAVVVLRGAGSEAFCAGFDLTALEGAPTPSASTSVAEQAREQALPDAPLIAATRAMRNADATFVAAIEGYAIGAGVELACACDLRLAKQGAWFQVPAARLGVVYHAEGLARIRHAFGATAAAAMLLLGRRLETEQALASGALLEVAAPDAFEAALGTMVQQLLAAAPQSLSGNRELLRALGDAALANETLAKHHAARDRAYRSEDHATGRTAASRREVPVFTGR